MRRTLLLSAIFFSFSFFGACDDAGTPARDAPDAPGDTASPDASRDSSPDIAPDIAPDVGPVAGTDEAWRAALATTTVCAGDLPASPLPPPRRRPFCGEAVTATAATMAVHAPAEGGLDQAAALAEHMHDWSLAEAPDRAGLRVRFAALDDFGAPPDLVLDGDEAYVLALRGSPDDGPETPLEALVLSRTDLGRGHALDRLAALFEGGGGAPHATETTVADAPALPLRVVIEGYYGAPWSHEARLDVIRLAGEAWMNAYLLAAKHDPANVLLWDQPLLSRRLTQFESLAAAGREHGVRLCVAISPGHTVVFSDETDRAAAVARFEQLHEIGVDCFALAFDDTPKELRGADPEVYAGYAEGQADFLVDVFRRTRAFAGEDAVLVFVPNDYWTEAAAASDDLPTVAAALPPWVAIAWTGPQICSPSITAADARDFAALAGRPPLLGDNDLVKDGDRYAGSLALAPYAPRPAALADELRGFGVNLMPLPYASLVGMWTAAAWAWNPAEYDPAAALASAAARGLPTALAPYATFLCPGEERLPPSAWHETLAACETAFDQDHLRILPDCEDLALAPWPEEGVPDDLGGDDEGWRAVFAREVRPWATKLARCAGLAREAVALGLAPARGAHAPEEDVAALEAAWQADCADTTVRLDLSVFASLVDAALTYARVGI